MNTKLRLAEELVVTLTRILTTEMFVRGLKINTQTNLLLKVRIASCSSIFGSRLNDLYELGEELKDIHNERKPKNIARRVEACVRLRINAYDWNWLDTVTKGEMNIKTELQKILVPEDVLSACKRNAEELARDQFELAKIGLPPRTTNIFNQAGIYTVGQIRKQPYRRMSPGYRRGLGVLALKKVRMKLRSAGVNLDHWR